MKIAILSRDGTLYSCRRLREAAQQRGHQVEILDPLSCYMNVSPVASSIHYKGRQLPHFDAVIPRIGSAITYYGTAALRQFELLGSYPLNESVAITRARDKLRSLQLLARQGIDLPLTGIAHSPDDTSDLIAMVGGAPLVVKLVEGTQGIGVVLAETRQAAESVIDAFRGLNAHILVQEYIAEAKGCDIRCLVVGNEVVAAIERRAKEGDFRSNLHRGGMATVAQISDEERAISIKATQTLGLDVAGVDILRATRGPLVMEVNASPGLEGVETTTGVDIASRMIAWIERQATPEFCLKIGG
ncbi:TPA: 30S ribosomal protein S6--L-glutamate ligase [Klebsiella variicola]|uniref:30S ribosomal protein S6--L-glutamate ligase n=1 Tax=Klebsiella variicola TaxID=244366 RepID=UPI000D74FB5E|nr:30S ribosomal protein S6--L-glutamate ligase [Klebsiella variicola]ELN4240693.1 30S ribosomal protein S6--L-glutamate ligase [Klebsiella variicola]ELQ4153115.1 30S ribosomal protein S6--L-glutamate ligase [Klebsiella variicola]EMC8481603.1 30S ribosomal protein S6--L-glutamate ligase [Klebsiella variicola]MDQ5753385.1 30S ribosomal protein S6--L-glutamate ligase [Klebsiella variicola subsp. variicola]PXJ88263.1 30S ribosomal protein S6--L-glutamate ligase [Klebsiella variicola]